MAQREDTQQATVLQLLAEPQKVQEEPEPQKVQEEPAAKPAVVRDLADALG